MADKQKSDSFQVELAIQRELAYRNKVPCLENEVVKTLSRTPSFKDWTDTGSISNASVQANLLLHQEPSSPRVASLVQSSMEIPRLPSSSPRPQNRMGQSSIKVEPYSSELSGHRNQSSAMKDWIGGPSKLSGQKMHTFYPEVPSLVPFSIEKPILHRKSPPPRPNPKPDSIQETNTARPLIRSPNSFQKPNIPTKPRSDLKRKSVTTTDREPCRNPTTSTNNSNMALNKSVDNLLCELCQVSCSSALTMRQHLNGRPHKAKMEFMKLKRNCIGERKGKPRCDVCQIWCSDIDGLEMHFKGQKHKAKMEQVELCKKNGGGIVAKKPILCELCRVHSMNEDLFKMHLKGRQHAAREELKRRGML